MGCVAREVGHAHKMSDDTTIIEGSVKFRDGRKWKSRWCVMRKLSPVADCVHLQMYRDSRARWAGASTKASLSLQQYLGSETSFTLDKYSNTLAIICRDLIAVLAFETRERLIQWQVKVNTHLGEPRNYLVLLGSEVRATGYVSRRLPAGPARLHLKDKRFALTSGVPPRLLGVWEMSHLRRYGVIEGRFCFEGGSHCGKGEGLHALITDQANDISYDFNRALQGRLSPKRKPVNKNREAKESLKSGKTFRLEISTSELNSIEDSKESNQQEIPESSFNEELGARFPYWLSEERSNFEDLGLGDTASVNETIDDMCFTSDKRNGHVTLERCMSCFSKLGALSRSSTAVLTPVSKNFTPAWTMEAVRETLSTELETPKYFQKAFSVLPNYSSTQEIGLGSNKEKSPEKPVKLTKLNLNLKEKLCTPTKYPYHEFNEDNIDTINLKKSYIYENYDLPKLSTTKINNEYYDTPKRIKDSIRKNIFQITKETERNSVIFKKTCECLLNIKNKRKEPTVVDSDESLQHTKIPCHSITKWAQTWVNFPYCRRNKISSAGLMPNKENLIPRKINDDKDQLYATIDISRKKKIQRSEIKTIKQNSDTKHCSFSNYENLDFALSLEHYENAKDLLRKSGFTQSDLEEIALKVRPLSLTIKNRNIFCTQCGHIQSKIERDEELKKKSAKGSSEYLIMAPSSIEGSDLGNNKSIISGYTTMSPVGGLAFHTLRHTVKDTAHSWIEEKSASNPALSDFHKENEIDLNSNRYPELRCSNMNLEYIDKKKKKKRSNSVDSFRCIEDVKKNNNKVGSRSTISPIEPLYNITLNEGRTVIPCDGLVDNKKLYAENSKNTKKRKDNLLRAPLTRRSSSVPGKSSVNRDSSSSNDSGVSGCSLRLEATRRKFELPLTTSITRNSYKVANEMVTLHSLLPRRSKSTDQIREFLTTKRVHVPAKSASTETEVPVLSVKKIKGAVESYSSSSGASDLSDYIETHSLCSSYSSTDTPLTLRVMETHMRQTTSTLRPRSGKEYFNLDPRVTLLFRESPGTHLDHSNLP